MGFQAFCVDAFAERPFTGNPGAVVFVDQPRDDAWRQAVAAEFNLSETAFLEPEGGAWRLRWFTPLVEIDLCGHGTLAAAHALWESGRLPPSEPARFLTKSGPLAARREGPYVSLDMPARPAAPAKPAPGLLSALRDTPLAFLENDGLCLLEMDSEDTVRRASPDLAAWARATPKGLVLTARSARSTADCVSRCFFPAEGIPEDPVTGSAHCAIGPYWAERLGKPVLTAIQASKRGGVLLVRPKGDRVDVAGRALTAWRGTLEA